ncbi:hypothetical protein DSM104443_01277 [Usitatibacter rugosus]|uniref:Glycosyl transferase family 2 n=1 Tax=Usitatibacter rugosus TaxID=2732067 RepID=A0A6M4GV61_9PROT|nr:hypothetical protein [Usitatibacter rugosus]QJR10223.1 hypothetical protein DSM104443_01277 [Usitatibacter rugosus]
MSASPIWAISCLFNPRRYRARIANFREFRSRLEVPLVAVELSFDGRFELGPEDADVLVQVEGGDVMWQKERLLNLGRAHLPAECEAVAMLDADVVFTRRGWTEAARERLRTVPVLQLFERMHYLEPSDRVEEVLEQGREGGDPGYGWALRSGAVTLDRLREPGPHGRGRCTPGFAWAYRRDLLDRHGLFDGNIIGGGDTAMLCAGWGAFDAVEMRHAMTPRHRDYYRAWAEPWFADVKREVHALEGHLLHLHHGTLLDRKSYDRHRLLAAHEFDPYTDIAPHAAGSWRWASDKPEMHRGLERYFADRREDG